MNSVRTKAIVLRRTDYGEADRIIQLLTPDGRRAALARGVRREKSKLAGGIELFCLCDVVLRKGRGELYAVTSARADAVWHDILHHYDRLQFAYEVLKLIARASETVDEPEWFEVLQQVLMALDDAQVPLDLVKAWFYVHHAGLLGHELSVSHDVSGETLQAGMRYTYDVAEQGLAIRENGELTSDHIKLLRLVSTKPLATVSRVGGLADIATTCAQVAEMHAAI